MDRAERETISTAHRCPRCLRFTMYALGAGIVQYETLEQMVEQGCDCPPPFHDSYFHLWRELLSIEPGKETD